jgi:hypothetical protein
VARLCPSLAQAAHRVVAAFCLGSHRPVGRGEAGTSVVVAGEQAGADLAATGGVASARTLCIASRQCHGQFVATGPRLVCPSHTSRQAQVTRELSTWDNPREGASISSHHSAPLDAGCRIVFGATWGGPPADAAEPTRTPRGSPEPLPRCGPLAGGAEPARGTTAPGPAPPPARVEVAADRRGQQTETCPAAPVSHGRHRALGDRGRVCRLVAGRGPPAAQQRPLDGARQRQKWHAVCALGLCGGGPCSHSLAAAGAPGLSTPAGHPPWARRPPDVAPTRARAGAPRRRDQGPLAGATGFGAALGHETPATDPGENRPQGRSGSRVAS